MAQTKKKRRRKHRGTQAGTVERPTRARRPATKQDRRELAKERREERLGRPPSWRSALGRAALAAALFLVIAYFLFEGRVRDVILATAFAFPVYVLAAYYTDLFRYRRYTRRKAREGGSGGDQESRPTSAAQGRAGSRRSRRG